MQSFPLEDDADLLPVLQTLQRFPSSRSAPVEGIGAAPALATLQSIAKARGKSAICKDFPCTGRHAFNMQTAIASALIFMLL
jgi:hypothetical protein